MNALLEALDRYYARVNNKVLLLRRPRRVMSEEQKQKISLGCKGHNVSPEARARIGAAHRGKVVSQETREKMRQARLGVPISQAVREQHSAFMKENNPMQGRKHSPEAIEKMRAAKRGANNPLYGRGHTPETRAKMSASRKGVPSTRDMKGVNNPYYGKHHTPEQKQRHREWMLKNNPFKGKRHSEKTRDLLSSKVAARLIERPELSSGHHHFKTGHYDSVKAGKSLFYGSSYELCAFKKLEVDPSVVEYDRCRFWIPYMLEGIRHRYSPDIFVTYTDGRKVVIEIKPLDYMNTPDNVAKFSFGRQYCAEHGFEYVIWTEVELGLPFINSSLKRKEQA